MSNIIEKVVISIGYDGKKAAEGLAATDKSLNKVKKAAKTAGKSMTDEADAIAKAYAGIRTQLTLLAGAFVSVSGIKSFLSNSISDITKLGYASKNLGMTTEKLEQFQLANEKMGGSKGGITSYLTKLTKELGELQTHGRGMFAEGGDLYSFLARLGNRSTQDLKSGEDAAYLISDMLKEAFSESEATGLNVAERLGVDGETLNLLRLGSKEVRAFVEEQKKYATISAQEAKATQKFGIEIDNVKDSFMATGREIFIGLLPVLKQVNHTFGELGEWFRKNKNDIGKTIEGWALKASEFIKSLFGDDNKIQTTLDNWANKFERLVVSLEKLARAAGLISDSYDLFNPKEYKKDPKRIRKESQADLPQEMLDAGLSSNPQMIKDGKKIVDFFVKKGWSREQASGLAANLWAESGYDPKSKQKGGGPGRGIAQWTHGDSREALFKKLYNKEITDSSLEEQLNFVDWELRNNEAKAGYMLKNAKTAKDAGRIVSMYYERPKAVAGDAFTRGQYARRIFAETYDNTKNLTASQSVNNSTSTAQTVNINTLNLKSDDTNGMMKDIISKSITPRMSNQFSNSGVR